MSIIIDTPDGMAFFQLLQFEGRLKIETGTGLSFRTPTLKTYNQVFGTKFGRKALALEDCQRRIHEAKILRVCANVTDFVEELMADSGWNPGLDEDFQAARDLLIGSVVEENVDKDMQEGVLAWFLENKEER